MSEQILIYGQSGTSKTTQCGIFQEYEARRTGQPGLHVTLDSSIAPMQDQIDAGMVKVWNLAYETPQINASPITALNALARGFMPKHLAPSGARQSHEYEAIQGSVSIEGLYMISEALKQYFMFEKGLTNNTSTESDGSIVGTAQMQIYDMIRNTMLNALTRMKGLHVPKILWTSHEAKGTDMNQAAQLGPAILPLKGLDRVPAFFAHCLRLDSIAYTNAAGQPDTARLLHFAPHKDPTTQLTWPAKTSLSPSRLYQLQQFAGSISNGSLNSALFTPLVEGQVKGGLKDFLSFLDANR